MIRRPSKETKLKMSNSHKGVPHTLETKRKISQSLTGKKKPPITEEQRKNMSLSQIARKRFPFSLEVRKKMSEAQKGEKAWNWQGGISSVNQIIRRSMEFRLWRKAVFERDNFTCQKTGVRGGYLVAHHINNFADFPELRFAIDNGITLSKESHIEFHNKYGRKNNSREQLDEFLKVE